MGDLVLFGLIVLVILAFAAFMAWNDMQIRAAIVAEVMQHIYDARAAEAKGTTPQDAAE